MDFAGWIHCLFLSRQCTCGLVVNGTKNKGFSGRWNALHHSIELFVGFTISFFPPSSPLLVVFYVHRPGRRAWLSYRHSHSHTHTHISATQPAKQQSV